MYVSTIFTVATSPTAQISRSLVLEYICEGGSDTEVIRDRVVGGLLGGRSVGPRPFHSPPTPQGSGGWLQCINAGDSFTTCLLLTIYSLLFKCARPENSCLPNVKNKPTKPMRAYLNTIHLATLINNAKLNLSRPCQWKMILFIYTY